MPTRRIARFTASTVRAGTATSSAAAPVRAVAPARLSALDVVVGDAQQQRDDHEVGDERRPAVRDERQRDAGERDHADDAADDDERLDADDRGEPGGEQLRERPVGLDRDAEAAADEQQERDADARPCRAGRAPRRSRRTRSRSTRSGSSAGCRARARCPRSRRCRTRNIDCTIWKPLSCGDRPRVDPRVDAVLHVAERAGTRRTRRRRTARAPTTRYDRALGRDVEHRREHREEQQRRAEVLLAHHHEDRDAPREEQRSEVLRVGQRQRDRCGGCRRASSSRLSTRYAAKKMTSSTLAASPGWKFSGPMRDPEPGAVDLLADARGASGRSSAATPRSEERVAVPLERADVAHDHEGQHERGDADRGPHRLHAREVAVEARDRDEADAVEQRGERQQRGVGIAARSVRTARCATT